MDIFVLDFNPPKKIVNGLGSGLMKHSILEVGFGKEVSQTDVEGMNSVHKLVEEGTDGMIRNATTKLTLYVAMQVIFSFSRYQFSSKVFCVICRPKIYMLNISYPKAPTTTTTTEAPSTPVAENLGTLEFVNLNILSSISYI